MPKASDIPRGFCFAATACGLKKKRGLDLALIASDRPAAAAAVFTTNLVRAAPVVLSRENVRRASRRMRAIIVNSGNANCCTGREGRNAAKRTAAQIARELNCKPDEVIVCSTGVIGVPMKVERILSAAPALAKSLRAEAAAFARVTRAIMTTDTRPKWAAARYRIAGKTVRLLGCAKGAGMIHPNMATMLAFVLTDAAIAPPLLRRSLREVTAKTFNSITVDGDTSTNDTLAILANGASAAPRITLQSSITDHQSPISSAYAHFVSALEKVCRSLALAIVADGEGAHRVVEIEVRGARTDRDADRIARTIAHSPLVKTALAGADPNWGRILAAAGRAGVPFSPDRARITLADIPVFRNGRPLPFDERSAHRKLLAPYIKILFELGDRESRITPHESRIWTCDFTADYVKINASYRT